MKSRKLSSNKSRFDESGKEFENRIILIGHLFRPLPGQPNDEQCKNAFCEG